LNIVTMFSINFLVCSNSYTAFQSSVFLGRCPSNLVQLGQLTLLALRYQPSLPSRTILLPRAVNRLHRRVNYLPGAVHRLLSRVNLPSGAVTHLPGPAYQPCQSSRGLPGSAWDAQSDGDGHLAFSLVSFSHCWLGTSHQWEAISPWLQRRACTGSFPHRTLFPPRRAPVY
jgi:hypothetical protein